MHFHFTVFNHSPAGRSSLIDMFLWMRAGLEECGHRVTYSDVETDARALNVLWEFFTPESGAELARSGLRYGLIVTEFMDGFGFNLGSPQSSAADPRDAAYRARGEGFANAARGARFFWTMVESNVARLNAIAPASFVELGYSDSLMPHGLPEPSIDFSFTGIMTPHRRHILDAIAKRANVEWSEGMLGIEERNSLFFATRINLSPNKTESWQMPSPTRVGLALLATRGVALDWTPQVTRQSAIVGARPQAADFVDYALSLLCTDWRRKAERDLERYRAELPMKAITQRLLDESQVPGQGQTVTGT